MTLRKALLYSALMHIAVMAMLWIGMPAPGFDSVEPLAVIAVDIADFSETPVRKAPQSKPKEPEPVVQPEEPPAPPPAPREPDVAMIPPPPMPVPDEPTPVPAPPTEAAKDEPKAPLLPARPRPKPTPPAPKDDFVDSVLKTVELLGRDKPAKKPPPAPSESNDLLDDLAAVLDNAEPPPEQQTQQAPVLGTRLTASEEDAIRRQIEPCWNVPVGARNPEDLIVTLRMRLSQDGSVINVEVVDTARQRSDPFFRAAADSARRAVMNPRCTPFKLPADKYDQWKVTIMDFNPAQMIGR